MERMQDLDPVETGEWVDSLRAVLHHQGSARATYLLERLAEEARRGRFFQPDRRFRSLLLPSFQMYFRRWQERYAEGLPQMRYGGGSRLTRNPQKG